MAIFDLKANIDLKQNLNLYTTCKQLDSLNLILSVFDNSVQTNLTNYNVRLKAMKADKVPLVQEHTGISISGNVITIETDEQFTTTSGKTLIELQFIDEVTGKKKATFNLVLIVVSTTLEVERGISKATYTLLEELENKLDQASDFFENIEDAIVANNNLKKTISNSETAESNLETAITNANNKKNEVNAAITNATNKIAEVNTSISNANASKIVLDRSKEVADTTKSNLDSANELAEHNIEELNKLGDATDLVAKVQTNTENISKNTKSIEEVNSQMNDIAKPSLLINGGFQVWQRGTNFNSRQYTADRWNATGSMDYATTKTADGLRITKDIVTSTNITLMQKFETPIERISTLSIRFKSNIANSIRIGTVRADNSLSEKIIDSQVGVWTEAQFTIDGSAENPILNVYIRSLESSSITIDINWVKLELGTVATPFVPRPYTEELALCQRYYQIIKNGIAYPLAFWFNSNLDFLIPLSTPMRIKPTISIPDGKSISVKNFDDNTVFTDAILIGASGDIGNGSSLNLRLSKTNNGVKNGACWCNGFDASFDAEIY